MEAAAKAGRAAKADTDAPLPAQISAQQLSLLVGRQVAIPSPQPYLLPSLPLLLLRRLARDRCLIVESWRSRCGFRTDNASPIIIVTRATYGDIDCGDVSKIIDVTLDLQAQVKDRTLVLEREVNLNKLFRRDPSPGKRKQLHVAYLTRGFTGNLRVREKDDCLVASVELGYPPVPPPDDDDYVVN